MSTKPYAASANYINRMSDYCKKCGYNPKESTGDKSCPFNSLYWNFLMRNQEKLKNNSRMALIYRNMLKLNSEKLKDISNRGQKFRVQLQNGETL